MAFRCKNCGGNILFDVDSQSMKCRHCESVFPPEEYRVLDHSTQSSFPEEGLTMFTCAGCGAALQGTEESQVGFCPYCGGQSLLHIGKNEKNATEYLLPFQVSKEKCAELFRENAKKVRYLPRELKNPEHLKSFTGIYMPYYEYDVQMGQSHIKGTTVENHASYEIVNTFQIDASVSDNLCSVPFDASRYLDDEIASRLLPYDRRKERQFNAAYLSGFYADASTVPPKTYYRDAEAQASKDVVEEVAERIRAEQGITVDTKTSHVDAKTQGHHSALLPMWFLTWRKGDRVAYAVVNGESGKVVSDLPVDLRAFFAGCGMIAVILFAVLELLFQPTPLLTSVISLIAGVLMAATVCKSTKQIFEKQTHVHDKGWSVVAKPVVQEVQTEIKRKRQPKTNLPLALLVFFGTIAAFFVLPFVHASLPQLIAIAAVIYLVLEIRKVVSWQRAIPEKQPLISMVLILAAVILNAVIVFVTPVSDFWYYLGDAACILILVAASVGMTQVYNMGATRPLPKLFDRNEVG